MKLRVISSLCTGCLNCVTVCSLARTGRQDPAASVIRVKLDLFSGSHSHIWCRQCAKAPCASSCPRGAIERNNETGAWEIRESECVDCGLCADACPFGALFLSPLNSHPQKCDLCGGEPLCADACTFDAITVERCGD
jgi:carbon-monoxide dehydrogenase iron sulfur subunit